MSAGSQRIVRYLTAILLVVAGALIFVNYGWALRPRGFIDAQWRFVWGKIHFLSVGISAALTLAIYGIADEEGFYDCLKWDLASKILYLPFMWFTLVASACSFVTVGNYEAHLIWLMIFFLIFVVWDYSLWKFPKNNVKPDVDRACEDQVHRWLVYIDIPSFFVFASLYFLMQNFAGELTPEIGIHKELVPISDIFIGGAIGFFMVLNIWHYVVDALELIRT